MSADVDLAKRASFGLMTGGYDGETARKTVKTALELAYESLWVGDHIAASSPINDPLIQLAFFSALAPGMKLGTSVYLVPLRQPPMIAKMVTTLDRMAGAGNFIFGVGVGGEYEREWKACGVATRERGGRMDEALPLLRRLWSETEVEHHGKYFDFGPINVQPKPLSPGGPPIWVGGRAESALRRAAHIGNGWLPYIITSPRLAQGLEQIARAAAAVGRKLEHYGTGLFIFYNISESYEHSLDIAAGIIGGRWSMDFRESANRYCALGRPADVAERIGEFYRAGARDFIMTPTSPPQESDSQVERFGREVIPLLAAL